MATNVNSPAQRVATRSPDPIGDVFHTRNIEAQLAFGFDPSESEQYRLGLLAEWSRPRRRSADEVSERALVREGRTALSAAVQHCLHRTPQRGDHVVFLSGGLDSRTILGALLDHFSRNEIVAATFGMPGEQDFDFATRVAKKAGIRHERLESASVDWSTDGLVSSVLARQVPLPFPFGQRYLSYCLHSRLGKDHLYWDGLCGDAVSGDQAPGEHEAWTWESATERFVKSHLRSGWKRLTTGDFNPMSYLPEQPFCEQHELSFPDQLDFGVRQTCYTATRRLKDFPIATPFLSAPWLDFMLSAPVRYRHRQRLYLQIQREAFPRLFTLPTTTFDGGHFREGALSLLARRIGRRARRAAHRIGITGSTTESGANAAIRSIHRASTTIRDIARENLTDLTKRRLLDWIDIDALSRDDHGMEISEHDRIIVALLSLEINLKAADRANVHAQRRAALAGE